MSNFKWKPRKLNAACYEAAINKGYNPFVSGVLSKRYDDAQQLEKCLTTKLKGLDNPALLKDVGRASERIVKAIKTGEVIAIETDHDADGVTSHAVLFECLHDYFKHPKEKLKSYIGHRLKEGYGLSQSLAERILADKDKPTLVITADNGSSDEARIAFLKSHGIDTIVTDHHQIPVEGVPKSAYAVVSPTQDGCEYPDQLIAGCMVACLLMAQTRQLLSRETDEKIPSVVGVFDFVALGTTADCVSLANSVNNRLVINKGLKMMNTFERPCWRAMRQYLSDENKAIKAEDLGFVIAPRLNARGRLDEAMSGVHFLLAKTDEQAQPLARLLDTENTRRKAIEKELKDNALEQVKGTVADKLSITVFLEKGHPGVHGIVSSRITEKFGRPSVMISPKAVNPAKPQEVPMVSASARGIPGFHVKDALQWVSDNNPGLLTHFGGHVGAAGMTFKRCDVSKFAEQFELAAAQQLVPAQVGPVILSDGHINIKDIDIDLLDSLDCIEPFGREFDYPLFEAYMNVLHIKPLGDGSHLKLVLEQEGHKISGIWFNACDSGSDAPVKVNTQYNFMFAITKNVFRGSSSIQLRIEDFNAKITPKEDLTVNLNMN